MTTNPVVVGTSTGTGAGAIAVTSTDPMAGMLSALIAGGGMEKLEAFASGDAAFKTWVEETLVAIAGAVNAMNRTCQEILGRLPPP